VFCPPRRRQPRRGSDDQRRSSRAASLRRSPELTARRSTAARSDLVNLANWWRGTRGLLIQGFEVQHQLEGAGASLCGTASFCGFRRAVARMAVASARLGPMSLVRSTDGRALRSNVELTGRRREDARPGPQKMYRVPAARAWWPAVGAPVERRVRRHAAQGPRSLRDRGKTGLLIGRVVRSRSPEVEAMRVRVCPLQLLGPFLR